jgi:hypothetical protein
VTVVGFTLRNGILLLNRYRDLLAGGADAVTAVREGSMERMVPIILTSLTTIIGLVPIMLAGGRPGGELLAPLAIVQFGGLIGSTVLNLIVLPAAAVTFGTGPKGGGMRGTSVIAVFAAVVVCAGCKSHIEKPVEWDKEATADVAGEVSLASPGDAAQLALVGNRGINALRLKAAGSAAAAEESGWWEDPEFDFDLMRIVRPSGHPFLGGGSVAFTVPLSGALQRKAES